MRKVHWTRILAELLQKMSKNSRRAKPQWRWQQRRQPAWRCYAR